MSTLTIYLARLIGLFAVLVGAGCLVRGNAVIESTVGNGSVMLVYAMISLAVGLAMILGHNVWSRDVASGGHLDRLVGPCERRAAFLCDARSADPTPRTDAIW